VITSSNILLIELALSNKSLRDSMYNIYLATLVIAKSHNLTSSSCEIKNALYF
jgi:hypothetical protein